MLENRSQWFSVFIYLVGSGLKFWLYQKKASVCSRSIFVESLRWMKMTNADVVCVTWTPPLCNPNPIHSRCREAGVMRTSNAPLLILILTNLLQVYFQVYGSNFTQPFLICLSKYALHRARQFGYSRVAYLKSSMLANENCSFFQTDSSKLITFREQLNSPPAWWCQAPLLLLTPDQYCGQEL